MRRLRLENWKVGPRIAVVENRPLGADRNMAVLEIRGMLCAL